MDNLIVKALSLAIERHGDQRDKSGKPYIGHLLRVAARASLSARNELEFECLVCTGLLHDIVEDTPTTIDELGELFPSTICSEVDILTKRKGENYWDYLVRCRNGSIAEAVKIADLQDNVDPRRSIDTPEYPKMVERYKKALLYMQYL